ncbi:hypothetical protein QMZ92_23855 [Streptomyces sp. HNM0645]|uniref:hypothetical protein n=1 Tax=Streptomyces sp. HNM0645 TaxID=2782343 RepID=UPI0024B76BDD|nr:hypothetical protein [Streptomyces sp. HNM0645]MDI9887321.1 hypothetical protein [Streptomyces sp. HNM0645]
MPDTSVHWSDSTDPVLIETGMNHIERRDALMVALMTGRPLHIADGAPSLEEIAAELGLGFSDYRGEARRG